MNAVATSLRDTDNLRTLDPRAVPGALASVYDVVNKTHPFREGNGRVQREFVTALARESGHRLDWTKVTPGRPRYEELVRWPYDPIARSDGHDDLVVDAPGTHTLEEIVRAYREGLIDQDMYVAAGQAHQTN